MQNEKNKKAMNFWSATSIGVGAMIGAGLFALIGIAVEITGRTAYLAFMIAGIIAMLTSYSVSKMAVRYPSKGGRVKFLNKGFGNGIFAGSLNISMWVGYMIVTSLYARAFGEYGLALMGLESNSPWIYLLISTIVVVFILINFISASAVGNSELFIVAIKVVVLLFFGALGLTTANFMHIIPDKDFQFAKLLLASGVVFMSYEGFGLVANTAEDIQNPQKNLPRALYVSVAIVTFIYLLVSITVIGNLTVPEILQAKEYALAEAAKPMLGSLGFTLMGIAALFSTASAINATIYGPVHMLQETAKAEQISPFFIKRLLKHESGVALIITGIIILFFANLFNLEAIAETGSLIFLGIYAAVNVANFKLRHKTDSNVFIVLAGVMTTVFSFVALFYFELTKKSISIYFFGGILLFSFLYEGWYQSRKK